MAVVFVLQVRVKDGREQDFLERYGRLAARVAEGLDGHVVHRLCRHADEPDRWLIESEWESAEASQTWERSDEHRELTMPMRECWDDAQRAGYEVRAETRRGSVGL